MKQPATYVFYYTLERNIANRIVVEVKTNVKRPKSTKVYKTLLDKLFDDNTVHCVGFEKVHNN